MSVVLSPAEQARAHRLSAQALYERNPNAFEASRYALGEMADHLDPPTPPETVESLRAERDNALTNARTWEDLADGWRDRATELRGDVRAANDTIARLRYTHAEQIKDLKARWLKDARERSTELFLAKHPLPSSEAARGRCQRED